MSKPHGPPHHTAAERAVLAAILLAPDALDLVRAILTPDDLFVPAHRAVYEAMLAVDDAGRRVDLVSIEAALVKADALRLAGGIERVASLADDYSSAIHVEQHAERVRDLSLQRRLLQAAREVQSRAVEPADDVQDLIAWAEHTIGNATDTAASQGLQHVCKGLPEVVRSFVEAKKTGGDVLNGALTGLTDLDRVTRGFHPGELTILAARPSMGKTSLALSLACAAGLPTYGELLTQRPPSRTPVPVLIFSLEMETEDLQGRLLAAHSHLSYKRMREGNLSAEDFRALARTVDALQSSSIYIEDNVTLSIAQIRAVARQWARRSGVDALRGKVRTPGLIVVDYLQLVRPSGKHGSREQEVSEISRNLKVLARETGCAVVCLSQLNRSLEHREDKRPRMADLRESGAIEQDADKILFLYRPEVYARDEEERERLLGKGEVIVSKNRNGPTATVHVTWLAPQMRFADGAPD